jgi:hypothetical protein
MFRQPATVYNGAVTKKANQIALCLLSVAMLLPSRSASGQCDPKLKAYRSFIELTKARDTEGIKANSACFYDGTTPSGDEDEFFILVDGKNSAVKGGAHPGILMADFAKGQTVGLSGYGPMTKQEAPSLTKGRIDGAMYDTFDENSEREQISEVSCDDEKVLQWVDTTTIRKSTLRFHRTVEFPDETAGHTVLDFTGHCYKIALTAYAEDSCRWPTDAIR